MKLSEVLKTTDRIVKIGTKKGTGFVYIGRPEEALRNLRKVPRYEDAPHWANRKVLERYDSDPVVDETLIIVIEGRENGNRWFVGDTEKVPKKPIVKKHRRRGPEEPVPYRNHEGYADPTAFYALRNIVARQEGAFA